MRTHPHPGARIPRSPSPLFPLRPCKDPVALYLPVVGVLTISFGVFGVFFGLFFWVFWGVGLQV